MFSVTIDEKCASAEVHGEYECFDEILEDVIKGVDKCVCVAGEMAEQYRETFPVVADPAVAKLHVLSATISLYFVRALGLDVDADETAEAADGFYDTAKAFLEANVALNRKDEEHDKRFDG